HARLVEQASSPGDQIVEIGDARGALGVDIGAGKGLSGAKPRGLGFREFRSEDESTQRYPPGSEVGDELVIFRLSRALVRLDRARFALRRDQARAELGQPRLARHR